MYCQARLAGCRRGAPEDRAQLYDPTDHLLQRSLGIGDPLLYLMAAMYAANAPCAEVLTVIGQEAVTVFAYSGASPADYFIAIEPGGFLDRDPDRVSVPELRNRDLFHWTPVQPVLQTCVLHDPAAARVNTVMLIAATGCHEMCTQRRFIARSQKGVASPKPTVVGTERSAVRTSRCLHDCPPFPTVRSRVPCIYMYCADKLCDQILPIRSKA
jgi:hypothetical protein